MKYFKKILGIILSGIGIWGLGLAAPSISTSATSTTPLVGDTVNMTGVVSAIDSGCSLAYQRTQTNSPVGVETYTLQDDTTLYPYFVVPDALATYTLTFQFQLTVTGCVDAGIYTDTINIVVDPYFANSVAGDDQSVSGGDTVTLNGSHYGSVCIGGTRSFQWSQIGTVVSPDLFDESGVLSQTGNFQFTAPIVTSDTTFLLEYKVNCNGDINTDTLNLTVGGSNVGGSTHSKQTAQADYLFKPSRIDSLETKIYMDSTPYPLMSFYAKDLGGGDLIKYEWQISTSQSFDVYEVRQTVLPRLSLFATDLKTKSDYYYVRLVCKYGGLVSTPSEIILYGRESLLDKFKILSLSVENDISFDNIVDFLGDLSLLDQFVVKRSGMSNGSIVFDDILNN